jgi:hypothetical protein
MQYKATKPLTELQAEIKAQINNLASETILARYPLWKQNNMLARATELQSLGQINTPEWVDLQGAWNWIKAVRDASNAATNVIDGAVSTQTIYLAEATFKNTIATL